MVTQCTATCGPGEQRQRSICMQEFTGDSRQIPVDDAHCGHHIPRPPDRVACHVDCAGRSWTYTHWSEVRHPPFFSPSSLLSSIQHSTITVFGHVWRRHDAQRSRVPRQRQPKSRSPVLRQYASRPIGKGMQHASLSPMGVWGMVSGKFHSCIMNTERMGRMGRMDSSLVFANV